MRKTVQLSVILVGLIAAGCASTKFESTWKEPSAGPEEIGAGKFVAIALAPDSSRRSAEETIVNKIGEFGGNGTPSYRIIDLDASQEEMTARMKSEGFRAAVVVKLLKEDKELRSTNTGMSYGVGMGAPYGYGGFYGGGWGWGVYTAPEIRTDTLVYLETLVYSVDDEKLIWAGRSKTTNPSNLDKLISELIDAAINEMTKDGLLAKK